MVTQWNECEQQFMDYTKRIAQYEEAINLMYWDLRTGAPSKGVEGRSGVIATLSQTVHEWYTSDQMKLYINQLKDESKNELIQKSVEQCEKNYNQFVKIPPEEYKEYVVLQSQSEAAWEKAKETNDFELFLPYLEKMVAYNKKFANYWGYEDHPYNALLDQYEPGMTVNVLDDVFSKVRIALTELLHQVTQSSVQPDASLLQVDFPNEQQKAFSIEILKRMGYDFDAGRLDETVHPFAIELNSGDVRITNNYNEKDFRVATFGTIHEGGHALYEQNIAKDLAYTPLAGGTSMGIHESQSLFWENFVARSEAFWKHHYPLFQSYAPDTFKHVDFTSFYSAINEVKPSFIRIEADELTYCLHIMVRYELEKALINNEIEVKDLPQLWNDKMEQYLGIRPTSNKVGILQDVHWAGGAFGYFPSYALGYMYAAQLYEAMTRQIDVDDMIQNGDFTAIRQWLTEHIHQHGKKKKPLQLLMDATGEALNPNYLIQYLKRKYEDLYQIKGS
ncbi:carboxypeptidase M32 [Pontibacillus litoralis]|uniref:Metal-dependent carboxypeptidase n=1 Tax=Pontibacillus litoralis JSM 072002 TaxID=1385512 RepID=A0A0A5G779_9BACI|nr:carboxypeptidase M32 [Pontibacillus litoralis]KGX87919.1 peptidase M32 [Pontibacillus litoralis JSM 072002]